MHEYYVDLGFRWDVISHAAELASWGTGGASFTLTRAKTWGASSDLAYRFLRLVVTKVDDPIQLQGWVASAGYGLTANLEPDRASHNLVVLVRRLLTDSALRGEQVPFILAGARQPLRENGALQDPLETALRDIFDDLVVTRPPRQILDMLSGLLAHTSNTDKSTLTRVALTLG